MTAYLLSTIPVRELALSGVPVPFAKLHTLLSGTATPLATYTDDTGVTPLPNPIVADAGGFYPQIWVGPSAYDLEARAADDVAVLWQRNKVRAPGTGATTNSASAAVDASDFDATGTAIYGGTTDCAPAINAALAAHLRVQISGLALIKSQINATGKHITMLPGAAIILDSTTFTGARNTSTGVGILFSGSAGGGVHGGSIYPSVYTDDRALIAVRMMSCSGTRIDGVDMSGFSKANGIVTIDTCNDVIVTNCYFHDCTTNSATTGQITAVTIDDNRVGGVSSQRPRIIGNAIKGLTPGASFLAAFGYQTDGITVEVGTIGVVIADNAIELVGEGIDHWGLHGSITGNSIRDCYNYGIKLVHGASYNTVTGNAIRDSGLAGITLGNADDLTDTTSTQYNVIAANNISGVDPAGAWSASNSSCIQISDQSGVSYIPRNNLFLGNFLNPGPNGKYAIERNGSSGGNNHFVNTYFTQAGATAFVHDGAAGLGRITAANKTLARASLTAGQNVATVTSALLLLATKQFDDRVEFDVSTHRWTCQIPGAYRVSAQATLGTVTTGGSLGALQIRRSGSVVVQAHTSQATGVTLQCGDLIVMTEGQYLELWFVNADTATDAVILGADQTFLTIEQA